MKRMHIIGRKNSGKTTLIEDLLRYWNSKGYRVGTVKHTHHHHELDVPGKDSHRHREAGAAVVAILTPNMNAVFWSDNQAVTGNDRYESISPLFDKCDLILVEGNSGIEGRKIEVWRSATETDPIASRDESVLAIVTDDNCPVATLPRWPRSDIPSLAQKLLCELDLT